MLSLVGSVRVACTLYFLSTNTKNKPAITDPQFPHSQFDYVLGAPDLSGDTRHCIFLHNNNNKPNVAKSTWHIISQPFTYRQTYIFMPCFANKNEQIGTDYYSS